jgi:hypothetical protein
MQSVTATLPALLLRLSFAALLATVAAPDARADVQDVLKAVQRDGHARVVVRMKADSGAATWSPRQPASRQRAAVAAAIENVRPALREARIQSIKTFRTLPLVAATVTREQALSLMAAPDVEAVYLVRKERKMATTAPVLEAKALASSVASIDVANAWAVGYEGSGYAVAVIDGGFNLNHPMLAGKNVGDACFAADIGTTVKNNCPSGVSPQIGPGAASYCPSGSDRCDHGTHVASVAVGNDGVNFGVARGAKLVPIDVFSRDSDTDACAPYAAPCELTDSLAVLEALDYVNEHAAELNIAAVNLSLGGDPREGYCDDDPRKGVIDMLRQKGIAVAAASSNDGLTGKISAPACISSAVAVGATNDGLTVATFSNVASTLDVVAPGVGVLAAAGTGTGLASRNGTSVAAPHVAGAWAVMRSAAPVATFDQLENALKQTGIGVTRAGSGVVIPKIQVATAINRVLGKDKRVLNNLFSSAQPARGQSVVRLFNNSSAPGTVTVTVRDAGTGAALGKWTSPVIAPYASPQIAMETIEREAVSTNGAPLVLDARTYYNIDLVSTFRGMMQHGLWARNVGVLVNLSSCAGGFVDDTAVAMNVHASTISGYASRLRIVNVGAATGQAVLSIYDANTGVEIGQWTSPDIAAGATLEVSALQLEQQTDALRLAVGNALLQYNVRLTNLNGYLQHVIENASLGAPVDMSAKCELGFASAN